MVVDTAADWPIGVAVDDHIAASSMTSEAALNVADVGVPGDPFERLVVMTVAVGGV